MRTNECPACGLTEGERRTATAALEAFLCVPKRYEGTSCDYRNYDIVCCKHCRAPLRLEHRVSLLEEVETWRAIAQAMEADGSEPSNGRGVQ